MKKMVCCLEKNFDIKYVVVADVTKEKMEVFGDENLLDYPNLVREILGSYNAANCYHNEINNPDLPYSWQQGNTVCVGCRINDNIFIGFAYTEFREGPESFKFNQEVLKFLKENQMKILIS